MFQMFCFTAGKGLNCDFLYINIILYRVCNNLYNILAINVKYPMSIVI